MCTCWGCRTGNGHGTKPPTVATVQPATDEDRKAWAMCAADQRHTGLDVQHIVPAYEARIKALQADRDEWKATAGTLTQRLEASQQSLGMVADDRDALAAQVAALVDVCQFFSQYAIAPAAWNQIARMEWTARKDELAKALANIPAAAAALLAERDGLLAWKASAADVLKGVHDALKGQGRLGSGDADTITAIIAERDAGRVGLNRYGTHDTGYNGAKRCRSWDDGPETCDCGFDAALAATRK